MVESAAASPSLWARIVAAAGRHGEELAAGVLVATAAVVGIVLARRPLSVDEAEIVAALDGGFRSSLEGALEHQPGQVVYRALLHPLAAADAPEWALRMPSLAATLVAAALALWTGRMLAGRFTGVVAAVLVGLGAAASGVAFVARPHALAVLAVALSTALFVAGMTRRAAVPWVAWALVTAPLPLVHPVCAAAVAAQLGALALGRHGLPRVAAPAAAAAGVVATLLLAAAAVERSGAPGPGDESGRAFAVAVATAWAWSPVALAAAAYGVVVLLRRGERWQAALLAGLAAAPLLALAVAALAFPVHPRSAVVVALPGIALAAGTGIAAIDDRRFAAVAAAAAVLAPAVALAVEATGAAPADWRSAARFVDERSGPGETVVVLPARARAAYTTYGSPERVTGVGRGDGVWVVVRTPWANAVESARDVVPTPRYALLTERTFGDELVVQHWVRP